MAKIIGGTRLAKHLKAGANGKDLTDVLLRGARRTEQNYIDRLGSPDLGPGHTPSQPGEAPNSETGKLAASARVKAVAKNRVELSVSAEHAAPLEYGTASMAPRPALSPAFEEERPRILKEIREERKRDG